MTWYVDVNNRNVVNIIQLSFIYSLKTTYLYSKTYLWPIKKLINFF